MGQATSAPIDPSHPASTLSERTLAAVADYVNSVPKKRIVVLTGAGISTAAGIPDFRSPKTGLYHNLARLDLPYAEALFDIDYFRRHPEPFYVLAHELYPGRFHPTVSHAFIALLAQRGLLDMLFTQNIDCLERAAGVPPERIVESHGSFATQRCIDCRDPFPADSMREHVLHRRVPHCPACGGIIKPDITFFGEPLPTAFSQLSYRVTHADVVIVLGTSLSVYPFAGLADQARVSTPRLLLNRERVGSLGSQTDDVLQLGPCDEGVRAFADALGWRAELEELWRGLVGEHEARRQMRCNGESVEDEVQKLTAGIEAVLRLGPDDAPGYEGNHEMLDAPEAVEAKLDENAPDQQGTKMQEVDTQEDIQSMLVHESQKENGRSDKSKDEDAQAAS